jgi:hypothetical protein
MLFWKWKCPGKQQRFPSRVKFLTIRVSDIANTLLRRTFAISSFDPLKRTCSIIYQVRGCATEILSAKKAV